MAELARLRAAPATLAALVREATLTEDPADPYYEAVLLSITDGGLETPARSKDGSPSVYTSYEPAHFATFEGPEEAAYVVIQTAETLQWLEWFEDEVLTVVLRGDPSVALAETAEIHGSDHTVTAGPLDAGISLRTVDFGLTEAFERDGDGPETFAPRGEPAPTRVETDARTLGRLAEAAGMVHERGVPIVVEDGELRLDVAGDFVAATGGLDGATVDGPDVREWVGQELGDVARVLDGPVSVQIAANGRVAVVQEDETATRRYVLEERI